MKCNCSLCHCITALAYTLPCSLCFYTQSHELTSQAWGGACRPLGREQLMEVEVWEREWSGWLSTPRGLAHFMLFWPSLPLASELNVNQEAQEGPAQRSGGSHHEDRSTPALWKHHEKNTESGERAIEEEGEFREWDLHCHGDGMERSWKAGSCAFQKLGPPPCSAPKSSATMPVSAHK